MFSRICKICNTAINYKNKKSYDVSVKKSPDVKCSRCRPKGKRKPLSDERKKFLSDRFSGKNNPMFGKTFIDTWKEKYDSEMVNKLIELHKEKSKNYEKNGMTGKTVYSVWVEKYGEEKAKELDKIKRQKLSLANSGKNNPMYSKPSPKKSGNGWSGWYENIYFRSLLELGYIIYLKNENISFDIGEKQKYKIQYFIDNKEKNYFPDFIVGSKVIEIKPKALTKTKENKAKYYFARLKFKNNFIILTEDDIVKPNIHDLDNLLKNNKIILDPSTIIKYNNFKKKE